MLIMEKLIFSGECLETKELLKGSLIQYADGTHCIMFKEEGEKGVTSPVNPDTVKCVNANITFGYMGVHNNIQHTLDEKKR